MIVAVCFRALAVFTELSLNFKVNVTYLPSVAIPAMGGGYLILILCSVVLRNVHTREKMVPTVNVHKAIIISIIIQSSIGTKAYLQQRMYKEPKKKTKDVNDTDN